ncbi:MAG: SDR family oxidoreductase [Nitrososphaerota archaeon]|nr:SDR family oxidoreductase [Aigarchaeota archaeon]MDW8076194.1 SDR family oxidoreductase [Nitrososphaerota archaeon]
MLDKIVSEDVDSIVARIGKVGDALKACKILVTGGAGFLGSYVCDVLNRLGANVVCVDDLSSGRLKNVEHLFESGKFVLIRADVSRFESDEKFDYVLHMASPAVPEDYQSRPVDTIRANSLGTLNMLEITRKSDAKMLFTSTSEVYGDAKVLPTPETYWGNVNPIGVRSCYDEGKRFGEALIMAYIRQYGLDVRIVRIFNSFGPRMRSDGIYGRVVSRFIDQALSGKPITVYGTGRQTRSFCYVSDTITGILLSMLSERAKHEVINIGNPRETTILQLARLIKRMTNSNSKIVFKRLPQDDPKRRVPDIKKARRLLGWRPYIKLEKGLERTIEWFKLRGGAY